MTTKTKLGATMLFAAIAAAAALPGTASASSHREAPLMQEDPAVDNTDLWAFTSPDTAGTVTIVAGYIGLEDPSGAPNWARFSDTALYEIKIDNTGDAIPDITYRFQFHTTYNDAIGGPGAGGTFFGNVTPIDGLPVAGTTPNFHHAAYAQSVTVSRIDGTGAAAVLTPMGTAPIAGSTDVPVPPIYYGHFAFTSTPTAPTAANSDANYLAIWNQARTTLATGERVFAGPSDDPFFVDLGNIFDDVTFPVAGHFGETGGGHDTVGGYNLHTIAIQVPVARLLPAGVTPSLTAANSVIGIYASASRQRVTIRRNCYPIALARPSMSQLPRCLQETHGEWVQVSRIGLPLVNELLIPIELKDLWNGARPVDDAGAIFGSHILIPSLPSYAQALYGATGLRAPAGYVAPTRTADLATNDMATLVTGRGLVPGVPAAGTGFAPADLLRFNVATPGTALPTGPGFVNTAARTTSLGAAGGDGNGFPNGRRLQDDIIDIEERYVLNGLAHINAIPFGDGVDGNDVPFRSEFPYVAIPHAGNLPLVHRLEPAR